MESKSRIFFKSDDERSDLIVENARLLFRNFTGLEKKYNKAGDRNFAVLITEKESEMLIKRGWNPACKQIEATGEVICHLKVKVRYDNFPPNVRMHTKTNMAGVLLDGDTVGQIDSAVVEMADLVLHPYFWDVNEETGITAYLKEGHITLEDDYFAEKYAAAEVVEEKELPWDEE